MTDWRIYENVSRCIKCGFIGVPDVEYKKEIIGDISFGEPSSFEEFLLRTCNRCHFEWKEATLDSVQ